MVNVCVQFIREVGPPKWIFAHYYKAMNIIKIHLKNKHLNVLVT